MRLRELTKQQAYDKYGGREGARKAQQSNQSSVTGLQKPVIRRLTDFVTVTSGRGGGRKYDKDFLHHKDHMDYMVGRDLTTIRFKNSADLKKSGIYVWMHDDYGIFYIGIAGANNLKQRWDTHIQKLLSRVHSSFMPKKWAEFGKELIDNAGNRGGISVDEEIAEDLSKLRVVFYEVIRPEAMDSKDFKRELEKIESRLVNRMNPRLNAVSDPTKGSVTRDPNK